MADEILPAVDPVSSRGDRIVAGVLSIGVTLVMLAALAFKVFELDRYFVPKELVLNAAALLLLAESFVLAGIFLWLFKATVTLFLARSLRRT